MAKQTIWELIPELMNSCEAGEELFDSWLNAAKDEFAKRGDDFDALLSSELLEKLKREQQRKQKQFFQLLPNVKKRHTKAIWVGFSNKLGHPSIR